MRTILAAFSAAVMLLMAGTASAETCFLCGKDSTDGCAGSQQCRGTRDHCRKIGCRISGTASCSTAANVKICARLHRDRAPVMETCFNCGKDSSGSCAGHQQCRGSREHCREIGCKISGTGSCSTAANVKICADGAPERPLEMSAVQTLEDPSVLGY